MPLPKLRTQRGAGKRKKKRKEIKGRRSPRGPAKMRLMKGHTGGFGKGEKHEEGKSKCDNVRKKHRGAPEQGPVNRC